MLHYGILGKQGSGRRAENTTPVCRSVPSPAGVSCPRAAHPFLSPAWTAWRFEGHTHTHTPNLNTIDIKECVHVDTHRHACPWPCTHTHTHALPHVCTRTHALTHTNTHAYVMHTRMYMCVRTYARTHTHTLEVTVPWLSNNSEVIGKMYPFCTTDSMYCNDSFWEKQA